MNFLEKAINRQKARLSENPYLKNMSIEARRLARDGKILQNTYEQIANSKGFNPAAINAGVSEMQQNVLDSSSQMFAQANIEQANRSEAIQSNIDELEIKNDAYQELERKQKEAEKKAKKNGIINTISKIGTTALGAGVGAMAGDPYLGARLGSATGDIITGSGAFTGEFNQAEAMSGVGEFAEGIYINSKLTQQKNFAKEISGITPMMAKMNSQQLQQVRNIIEMKLMSGDYSGLTDIVNSILGNTKPINTIAVPEFGTEVY